MDLDENRFLIVGLGITGVETSKFLHSKGASVKATDSRETGELGPVVEKLAAGGVEIHCGTHAPEFFEWADTIVLSPGVRFDLPEIRNARVAGKTVISEIELAWNFLSKPVIGITGTNGKTTTTSLLSEMLKRSGIRIFTGGNIGTPLISVAEKDDEYDFLLLELSSFQLQGIKDFSPHIAVILNISPNHLDHHSSMEEYEAAKLGLFANQKENDWAVFNADDPAVLKGSNSFRAKKISFGTGQEKTDVYCKEDEIVFGELSFYLRNSALVGEHNKENIMAAVAVAGVLGCQRDPVQKSINEFRPLPHRMEFVLTTRGVDVYNDSKSTTPFATLRAIESLPPPIILIAGGKDKGIDYNCLKDAVASKVKALVLIGETREKIRAQLGDLAQTTCADSLKEATQNAFELSNAGDTLLFSPGCSSFDMFGSYEERGNLFKEIVRDV
ncbi:MAG: UDP-N-acetylmuramoyl-L-alanine--D-glutamate ligase [Candidatus Dadabacteria bacterium]|nr:UDP-N-acetylmuramoyl-L-alanine--D-glutamate ligase [Candidatus Dadabacteria bacterium]MDE0662426.1 UDP-N-acetylmuramoyl-L-alanine--D-glutamate ligase [Candidatus Dadabacteria bacterium]